jgi:hypothetical protein
MFFPKRALIWWKCSNLVKRRSGRPVVVFFSGASSRNRTFASGSLGGKKLVAAHLPSVLLLLRQRRVAAKSDLGTGFGATAKCVRRIKSGAAGNGLGTIIKYLRCTRNGAAGKGLGTTIKYL